MRFTVSNFKVSNRVFWAGVVLAASAIVSSSSRGGPDQVEFDKIVVKQITVVDESRKVRGVVGVSGGGGFLRFTSDTKPAQNFLTVHADRKLGGWLVLSNTTNQRPLRVSGLGALQKNALSD